MTDVFTKAKRSEVMSLIRSRGNKGTELKLISLMRGQGITGWRRHLKLTVGNRRRIGELRVGELSVERQKGRGGRKPKASSASRASVHQPSAINHQLSPVGAASGHQQSAINHQLPVVSVRPDFVFRAQRVAVFVDGCFWHGCPRHATRPKQNRKFWDAKIARNRARDRKVSRTLRAAGWSVLRIWECALTVKRAPATMARLARAVGAGKD